MEVRDINDIRSEYTNLINLEPEGSYNVLEWLHSELDNITDILDSLDARNIDGVELISVYPYLKAYFGLLSEYCFGTGEGFLHRPPKTSASGLIYYDYKKGIQDMCRDLYPMFLKFHHRVYKQGE